MASGLPPTTPWNRPTRAIFIDKKVFEIAFDEYYRGSRYSSCSISITWRSLSWLVSSFEGLTKAPCNHKYFQKIRGDDYDLWVEKLTNKKGYFVEIHQLLSSGKLNRIIIPSEMEKQGWFSFLSLISDYPKKAITKAPAIHQPYKAALLQADKSLAIPTANFVGPKQPVLTNPETRILEEGILVVQRRNARDDWPDIRTALLGKNITRCTINPCGANKALLQVYDQKLVSSMCANSEWITLGKYCVRFLPYVLSSFQQDLMTTSFGGWIKVHHLPPPLWNEQIFRYIGDVCGGFIEVASETTRMISLTEARLKIRKNQTGLIPAEIIIPATIAGADIMVQISSWHVGLNRKGKTPPIQADPIKSINDFVPVLTRNKEKSIENFESTCVDLEAFMVEDPQIADFEENIMEPNLEIMAADFLNSPHKSLDLLEMMEPALIMENIPPIKEALIPAHPNITIRGSFSNPNNLFSPTHLSLPISIPKASLPLQTRPTLKLGIKNSTSPHQPIPLESDTEAYLSSPSSLPPPTPITDPLSPNLLQITIFNEDHSSPLSSPKSQPPNAGQPLTPNFPALVLAPALPSPPSIAPQDASALPASPLAILPPLSPPPPLSSTHCITPPPLIQPSPLPNSPTLSPPPTKPSLTDALSHIATILLDHGLCIMAIPPPSPYETRGFCRDRRRVP